MVDPAVWFGGANEQKPCIVPYNMTFLICVHATVTLHSNHSLCAFSHRRFTPPFVLLSGLTTGRQPNLALMPSNTEIPLDEERCAPMGVNILASVHHLDAVDAEACDAGERG